MGERLGTRRGLTGGVRKAKRKSVRVRRRNGADRAAPQSSEREGERACMLVPTGGTRLPGTEGTRARARASARGARLNGPTWDEIAFSIF
jgi:hypothetical protein